MIRPVRGCVRPIDVVPMRQRQIPRAQLLKHAQHGWRILDHVPALYPQQTCDPSSTMNPLYIIRCPGLLEVLRVPLDKPQGHVELAHRLVQRHMRSLRS